MAKLVDAPSSGGGAARCAGSNPVLGTEEESEKQSGSGCNTLAPALFLALHLRDAAILPGYLFFILVQTIVRTCLSFARLR